MRSRRSSRNRKRVRGKNESGRSAVETVIAVEQEEERGENRCTVEAVVIAAQRKQKRGRCR